jgi:small-conductance mechanosensitive channel
VRLWFVLAVVVAAAFARAAESPPAQPAAGVKAAVAAPAAKGAAASAVQDPGAASPRPAIVVERSPTGTLTVFNRPIVTFRSTVLGVAPKDRASSALTRVLGLLERGGEGKITVEKIDVGDVVKIDGGLAFIIADSDVEPLSGDTLDTVTERAVEALSKAIAETREARDARLMFEAALWAGGATVVFLLLLAALRLAARASARRIAMLANHAAEKVKIGGGELVTRQRAIVFARYVVQAVFWAIVLLVTYQWLGYVLGRFPFTRAWGEQLNTYLATTAIRILTAIAQAIPELLIVAVIFVLARAATGILRNFFDGVQSHRIEVDWLDSDSARPTRRLANIAVWAFALAMAYPYIPGSDTEAFKGVSVLLGLMVSIGASGIVGQAASGLILMYTRTFRPGEYVRVGEHEGTIVEMGLFTTRGAHGPRRGAHHAEHLRAVDGVEELLAHSEGRGLHPRHDGDDRLRHPVAAGRGDAGRGGASHAGVLASPEPRIFQTSLSDFYVEYRLVCQAVPSDPLPRAQVLSTLHANVLDVFNESGVQIMSPHYLGDPAEAKVVPKARWYEAPARPPR